MIEDRLAERLLAPVLARNADVAVMGDRIVLIPIGHFVREVGIGPFEDIVAGHWGLQPLWMIIETSPFIWSYINIGNRFKQLGYMPEPAERTEQMWSEAFCAEIDEVTLPFLRSINSLEKLYEVVRDPGILTHGDFFTYFYMELALGNFEAAAALLHRHRHEWLHDKSYYWSRADIADDMRVRVIDRILEEKTYDQLPDLLRGWERRMAKRIDLTEFWKPTPFPFEAR